MYIAEAETRTRTLFSEKEIITDRILYACADRVPHLESSIKEYVLKSGSELLQADLFYTGNNAVLFEKKYQRILKELLEQKLIFFSEKSGRYFANDSSHLFKSWEYKTIDPLKDSPKKYFQSVQEVVLHIDYIVFKQKLRHDTNLLCEEARYAVFFGDQVEYTTLVEIVDDHLFIGRYSRLKTKPYCFQKLSTTKEF